jgi:hypothetical protein
VFLIREVIVSPQQEEHIWVKHRVALPEVDEVCESARLVIGGRDGSYAIYGQTAAGRYLVLFMHPRGHARFELATARDADAAERRRIRSLPPRSLYDDEDDEDE